MTPDLGMTEVSAKWGWFVALGVAMIILGVLAWFDVVAVTIAGAIVIGALLLVGGAFQIVHAFMTKEWRGFILNLFCGVLYMIGGVLIMNEPVQGALVLTLFVLATLVVSGVVRIVLAFQHRHMPYWGLMLFSGIVSFIVGILLWMTLPWSALWVLGTLIAVELLMQGVAWLTFGLSLRSGRAAVA
jgi:uncharacterized membrane protein HdeD (DUF308 family)